MSAVIYHNTDLATPKARWRAYFSCLSGDEANGVRTTDDERRRFMTMWNCGTVVWRDDGSLMSAAGVSTRSCPEAVWARRERTPE